MLFVLHLQRTKVSSVRNPQKVAISRPPLLIEQLSRLECLLVLFLLRLASESGIHVVLNLDANLSIRSVRFSELVVILMHNFV